jgi:hypothetical protein
MIEPRFELEVHVKALACFANPRNHPRWSVAATSGGAPLTRDLGPALRAARVTLRHAMSLCRAQLGSDDRVDRPRRNLPPADALPPAAPAPSSDPAALLDLRRSLALADALIEGLVALDHVERRSFLAALTLVRREVERSPLFGPLATLDLRSERESAGISDVDSIDEPPAPSRVTLDEAARSALSHALRCGARLARFVAVAHGALVQDASPARACVLLSLAREESRALERRLRAESPAALSTHFERLILAVPAAEILHRFDALSREARALEEVASALRAYGRKLRARVRMLFERELPSLGAPDDRAAHAAPWSEALGRFERDLRSMRVRLLDALPREGPPLDAPAWSDANLVLSSEALREDVWMFARVTQAFLARARAVTDEDARWTSGGGDVGFVARFAPYAREFEGVAPRVALAEPLQATRALLEHIGRADTLDRAALDPLIECCEALHRGLLDAYARVDARDALRDLPFDRRAAAELLARSLGT